MKQRCAFTLIELLVVVSIIGLLAALLFPSLRGARAQAKLAVCAANLRQIGIAFQGYFNDYNDRTPMASYLPSIDPAPLATDDPVFIADVLAPYTNGGFEVFECPDDRPGKSSRRVPNNNRSYFQTERCSYEYPSIRFRGRTIAEVANEIESFYRRRGRSMPKPENSIWMMRGYANFHGIAGAGRNRNYLYNDGHVSDFEE